MNDKHKALASKKLLDDAHAALVQSVLGDVIYSDIDESNWRRFTLPCNFCDSGCMDIEMEDDWFGRGDVYRIFQTCSTDEPPFSGGLWEGERTEFAPIGEAVAQWNDIVSGNDVLLHDRNEQLMATIGIMRTSIRRQNER
jgi:hypothetical protein